ncbi:cob(I)yrinic acid a,c-diamide adenosyltransferase [Anaerobacillus arseniciselenatis]|uniref:Cob(I)yrinic acid a,c-diamide adenosyltransferase n=1 Tax=Anaerobacillus arseniciselenatis TaxID=85682 RepID=A0A1S2LAB3_9BACI|nr:cob(I)yrinic acid a,c-diamide adenosyltransferase [Anaerobacillus arseniciselenatis]OIJ09351.1 cob(I)yrinic acid a,c-diamide adenosyltransferase [Anaerobacillus arseniciselenatis]
MNVGKVEDNCNEGLTLVYTGDGKGKTTAALGLAIRAKGQGKKVLVLQFIKSPERTYGEKMMFDEIGIEMHQLGSGFTWTKTPEEHRDKLYKAWEFTKEKVLSGDYDVIILDELNNALAIERFPIDDVLPLNEVVDVIRNRPKHIHLTITGRSAKQEIINIADLVTEMHPMKHYYDERIPAVQGIEF